MSRLEPFQCKHHKHQSWLSSNHKTRRAIAGYHASLTSRNRATLQSLHPSPSILTCENVDVIIVKSGTSEHHTMRVKSCCCDWIRATILKEAGMWCDTVEECAVHIEEIDVVFVRSTAKTVISIAGTSGKYMLPAWSTYVAKTGACSWTLRVRSVFLVAVMVRISSFMRISQSLISPLRLPLINSLIPPRCICTFVIHCL